MMAETGRTLVPTLGRSKGWGLERVLGLGAAHSFPAPAPGLLSSLAEEDWRVREASMWGRGVRKIERDQGTERR